MHRTLMLSLGLPLLLAPSAFAQHHGGGFHPGVGVHFHPAPGGGIGTIRGYIPPVPTNATVMRQSSLPLVRPPVSPILGRYRTFGGFGGGYGWGGYGGYGYGGYGGSPIQINNTSYYLDPIEPALPSRSLVEVPPAPNDHPTTARLTLTVPQGAEVFLQGKKAALGGTSHTFESPELKPGETYTFDVRVTWTENGKPVEEKRTLTMHAGDLQSLQYLAAAPATTRLGQ
jgi:uncharacterized protein (TIGR03000 family)